MHIHTSTSFKTNMQICKVDPIVKHNYIKSCHYSRISTSFTAPLLSSRMF